MSSSLNRRQFLQAGTAATIGLGFSQAATTAPSTPRADAVIFFNLVGGPSQLDTWDSKPNARSRIRGPFRPISTTVPGMQLSELFPQMAQRAHRFNLLRAMHSSAAPIHELGQQLLNTGTAFGSGPESPNLGAVVSQHLGERDRVTPWWHFSDGPIQTGLNVSAGQGFGWLRREDAIAVTPKLNAELPIVARCAVKAVETGARYVSINMYRTVFDQPSWDCHADYGALSCDLSDYRDTVAPAFDASFSIVLDELERFGLLERTLVVASGEFGRTPLRNGNGGRDHWANAWTAIVAGAGTGGGKVIGQTDAEGGEPKERPTTPQELFATMGHALGLPNTLSLRGAHGMSRVFTAALIHELWS